MQFLSLTFFSVLTLALVAGCASYRTKSPSEPRAVPRTQAPVKLPVTKTETVTDTGGAVWELFAGEQVTLQLKNVDSGENLTVIIDQGISHREVGKGHWELTGFEEAGVSYVSMNTSKKFVFRMNGKHVYAGSIVIGCPKVAANDFKLLKKMKFFNRYPFSSTSGLCEMVIGNNYSNVRSQVKKSHKNKKLNLILGF